MGIKSADLKSIQAFGDSALQAELESTKMYASDQILLEDVDTKNISGIKKSLWAKILAIGVPDNEIIEKNLHKKIFHETKASIEQGLLREAIKKLGLTLPILHYFAVYLEILREN